MTAPTIAPAMPPMAAPFLVLSFVVEAYWASAVIATSSDIMIPAMIFFMGPPYWLPLSSQPRCHNEITYVINLSAHGVGWHRMSARQALHNILEHSDLSFQDFVEVALYHPEH